MNEEVRQTSQAQIWKKLLLALCSVLFALSAGEIICRLAMDPPKSLRFHQDVDELRGMDLHDLAGVIQNDPESFWRFVPGQRLENTRGPFFGVISNRGGLREDHEIPFEKGSDELRVLFLGDSCTFGYGLDLKQGFVQKTEEQLTRALPGSRIECINAGVPGFSLFQGWRVLEMEGLRYQPDIVVICFGWNDMASWDNRSDFDHYEKSLAAQPPRLLRWSRLCQLAWLYSARGEATGEERPRLLPTEFRSVLERVQTLTRAHSVELFVVVWGFRVQLEGSQHQRTPWQRELYKFARHRSLSILDLVPEFQKLSSQLGVDSVLMDQGHATAFANNEIGKLLAIRLDPLLRERIESRR